MLRQMRQFVPKSTLLRIHNSITLSHFDYCSLVWDNCCEYLTDKLQKLQNRAARIITGRTYDVRSDDVLKELNWEPLKQRYKINKTIFMHKVRNDIMPFLNNLFKNKTNDRYDLRSNDNNYVLGKPKTNFMKKVLLNQLRRFGTANRVQPKKKALASTNLNVFLAAPDLT